MDTLNALIDNDVPLLIDKNTRKSLDVDTPVVVEKPSTGGHGKRGMLVYLDKDKTGNKMSDTKVSLLRAAKVITCTSELSKPVEKHLKRIGVLEKVVINSKRKDKN